MRCDSDLVRIYLAVIPQEDYLDIFSSYSPLRMIMNLISDASLYLFRLTSVLRRRIIDGLSLVLLALLLCICLLRLLLGSFLHDFIL